jgi:hypothetical protein
MLLLAFICHTGAGGALEQAVSARPSDNTVQRTHAHAAADERMFI